jgi:hypothetical protein
MTAEYQALAQKAVDDGAVHCLACFTNTVAAIRTLPVAERMEAMGMSEADYEATAYSTTWMEK